MIFYDIESLQSAFTLVDFDDNKNELNVFILSDVYNANVAHQNEITKLIFTRNPALPRNIVIKYHNLNVYESNIELAKKYGCDGGEYLKFVKYPLAKEYTIVDDTKITVDHDNYLLGYNNINYDCLMLSKYFADVFDDGWVMSNYFQKTSPELMREFNNELFDPTFKSAMFLRSNYKYTSNKTPNAIKVCNSWLIEDRETKMNRIYQEMTKSGRHIDVSRLNEKLVRVGLKKLLGMLGHQILEPEIDLSNNTSLTWEELKDLIAYNVSDVYCLKLLFQHPFYKSKFELKLGMLESYPELIFEKQKTEYKPDIKKDKEKKWNRLTINSSSTQMATYSLCPYGKLKDAPVVSFNYPSQKISEKTGRPIRNILQDTKTFITNELIPLVNANPNEEGQNIINELLGMCDMYAAIENKNFNSANNSDNEIDFRPDDDAKPVKEDVYDIKNYSNKICVPYMGPDGKATDCYVTFSIGGIHGAQYNKKKYDADIENWKYQCWLLDYVKNLYPDAKDFITVIAKSGKPVKRKNIEINGKEYTPSTFVKSGATFQKAEYKDYPKKPELFPKDSKTGLPSLHKKYAYTSYGPANHEDFTSYYPSMLINMSAFENEGLGYDRYSEIFEDKTKFGKLMKDKSLTKEEQNVYKIKREGVKLILNSASGGADTDKNSPIRMNNNILSMRIIGQLFAWRIGQKQSLLPFDKNGEPTCKVFSTNTDGLYTFCDEETNNKVLFEVAEQTGVGMEPELMYLVSKDANNRLEAEVAKEKTGFSHTDLIVTGASGGTLGCAKGPDPTKSLAHPAILDWATCEILKYQALKGEMGPFPDEIGNYIIKTLSKEQFTDKKEFLLMFQNLVSSSTNTINHVFATSNPITDEWINEYHYNDVMKIQHYNRVFYISPDKVDNEHKHLIRYIASAYIRPNGKGDNLPLAVHILKNLYNETISLATGDASIKKVTGIEPDQAVIIVNEGLEYTDFNPDWLDMDYYVKKLKDSYESSWMNE